MVVWDAGIAVVDVVGKLSLPAGTKILELGAGTGFSAISLAKRGFDVVATDLPHVLPFIQRNWDLNSSSSASSAGSLRVAACDLSRPGAAAQLAEALDLASVRLIIAADVVYDERMCGLVVAALEDLLQHAGAATRAVVANEVRDESVAADFARLCHAKFHAKLLSRKRFHPSGASETLQVWELRRRRKVEAGGGGEGGERE
jgi:predicted nicotinamide N-methyase